MANARVDIFSIVHRMADAYTPLVAGEVILSEKQRQMQEQRKTQRRKGRKGNAKKAEDAIRLVVSNFKGVSNA